MRCSLLSKVLLIGINHAVQVELLLQQHEAMVAVRLDRPARAFLGKVQHVREEIAVSSWQRKELLCAGFIAVQPIYSVDHSAVHICWRQLNECEVVAKLTGTSDLWVTLHIYVGMLQCAPISECYSYTWYRYRYRYKLRIYRPIPEPDTYNEGVLRQNPSRPPRITNFWQ